MVTNYGLIFEQNSEKHSNFNIFKSPKCNFRPTFYNINLWNRHAYETIFTLSENFTKTFKQTGVTP
jgi:hypothetical protein